jgi:hypothetical protein
MNREPVWVSVVAAVGITVGSAQAATRIWLKSGYGMLVVKRRVPATVRTEMRVE